MVESVYQKWILHNKNIIIHFFVNGLKRELKFLIQQSEEKRAFRTSGANYPTEALCNRVPLIRILVISSSAVHPAWQQRR
jgi:hypothetical protein